MKIRRLTGTDIRGIEVEEVDLDALADDGILVRNEFTAVSVGTEIYNWLHGCEPGGEVRFPRVRRFESPANRFLIVELRRAPSQAEDRGLPNPVRRLPVGCWD